ncbi:MAG: CBS and ACT domain-containing protein [Anaerolineae bacterium]
MFVRERMTPDPITVDEDTSVQDALHLMRERRVRRFPVVNAQGRLVGMVSEKDLLYASPSPATTLSVYEIGYLLSKVRVKQVMNDKPVTIDDDCPLEEAARIMVDNRISGLPVMHRGRLVGIITETDLFKIFLELLGARERGLRLTLRVPNRKGMLAVLAGEVSRLGGDIIALGTFQSDRRDTGELVLKVREVDGEALIKGLASLGVEVLDTREV